LLESVSITFLQLKMMTKAGGDVAKIPFLSIKIGMLEQGV
jgi:hypothetical protein